MPWQLLPASQYHQFHAACDTLNASGYNTPLLDSRFIHHLLTEFGTGQEVLAINGDINAPTALTLLLREKNVWSTFQPSQAPIGLWHSHPTASVSDLMQDLFSTLPGYPLLIGITQQDPDLLSRPNDQGHIRTLDYIDTARISVSESFEDYWSGRGKNLRRNVKRQKNRLQRDGITTRLEKSTLPSDVDEGVKDYGSLESAGWKASTGTAVHPDNAQGRFYSTMLKAFCETGDGLIYRYWYNDRLVATDLCIKRDKTLVILKTTYDESEQVTSPAMLMHYEVFKDIFDQQQIQRIEFYGRIMDWHRKWTNEIRTMYHINHYRWRLLPAVQSIFRRS
ncbi:MAG TPA: GNAT family N-acetyltransferase [Bacteroidetes bacterium]|nr:GNAT family N-acetyltransferase [Bacteroidota bacterium]HEX05256.1 GNAT family N-acetyltransferase [Bacteroidota bacterium]